MTVASEISRSGPYIGNGVTTIFNYGFRILNESHLRVIRAEAGAETVLAIDTDYIVSDVGEPGGGQIALLVAPTASQTITILRSVPFTQETDLENQGAYFAETIEAAFDQAAMRDQQLNERLDRALVVPASADSGALEDLIANVVLLVGNVDDINTVAGIAGDVTAVAEIADDVPAVAANAANIDAVSIINAQVSAVAGIAGAVSAVAAIDDDVVMVADHAAELPVIAGNMAAVTTVAGIAGAVTAVASIDSEVAVVAANVTDIANFSDVWQGSKPDNPALRNDGSALQNGDLYFNSTVKKLMARDGGGWLVAGAASPTTTRGDLIARGESVDQRLGIGTVGSHLQSDGTDAGWALFLRPAIGAVARSWLAKATDFVSVLDFGLDPTGATSCTAKFNAAIAACPHLYFPPGTYKFDTAPAAIAAGSYCLRGAGWNTIIQTTFATGDAFVFSEDAVNARSLVIQDLYFISTVTRTSGATIRIWGANQNGSSWSFLNRINILGTCNGIQVDGGSFDAEQCGIGFITGSATVPGSAAITLNNALNASHLKSVTVFGSTSGTQAVMPSYGIRVIKAGELTMNAVDLILAGNALYVSPPSGVIIQGIAISDSFFDTSGTGATFTIDAGSTGVVRSVKITNSWFSNNTGNGLVIGRGAGATGSVGGFDLVGNTYIANSAGAGVVISDASVKGVNLIGGVFAQNSIGYAQTVPGVSDFKVIGAFFGAFGNFAGNTYDIYLGGGAQERFNVSMNTVTAAVASQRITTGAQTGTTGRVHDNPGYNSVGAANVTTAASPWTYTAGVSPETLYVSATTGISAVTQGGVSILPAALAANVPLSVQLGPNESVVLTYTGTLSAKKMVH